MLKEEYQCLKNKHLRNGLDSMEAHDKITKFKEMLDEIKQKMKLKKKSDLEIDNKMQREFEKEFSKLCYEQIV